MYTRNAFKVMESKNNKCINIMKVWRGLRHLSRIRAHLGTTQYIAIMLFWTYKKTPNTGESNTRRTSESPKNQRKANTIVEDWMGASVWRVPPLS